MPELPEVEVLVRHLRPLLQGKTILRVTTLRPRVLRPTSPQKLSRTLRGARFVGLSRRGKFLLFALERAGRPQTVKLAGHLGMSGRMYLLPAETPLPKHTAVVLDLGKEWFVFEDTRYFGRLTLDENQVAKLGPEPLSEDFTKELFFHALKRSSRAIKVKLLDQTLVAGLGNIYASEALFRARISPKLPARALGIKRVHGLWRAIREVLTEAIECGSTVSLNHGGLEGRDRFFYFGRAPGGRASYEERLQVYGRCGEPCLVCGTRVERCVQAARSTFYCPRCQSAKAGPTRKGF